MKEELTLVVMAAGMGSRFGGIKQASAVAEGGLTLLDFSLYDAAAAGFERAVFVIRHAIEEDFRRLVGDRIAARMPVTYVYQENDDLPAGAVCPADRVKPWGTGHAVLCCRRAVRGPFAVINSDDYYGRHAFAEMAGYLRQGPPDYCMTGFRLAHTLSENGPVARGICDVENGFLRRVTERTGIRDCRYTEDGGETWIALPADSIVSMNLWGFTPDFFTVLEAGFRSFLAVSAGSSAAEFYLPQAVADVIASGRKRVRVFVAEDRWIGMTYREDRQLVAEAMDRMLKNGYYPGL